MNPTVKTGNVYNWKVENIDKLDESGIFSDVFETDDKTWRLHVKTCTSDKTKYLSFYMIFQRMIPTRYVYEVSNSFELLPQDSSRQMYNKTSVACFTPTCLSLGHDQFLSWSDVTQYYVQNNSFTVQVEFDYKYYDFYNITTTVTNSVISVYYSSKYVNFHVSKSLLCIVSKFFTERFLDNQTNEITIYDVKHADFAILLASLYPDPIAVTGNTYEILMDLSVQFEIPFLIRKCENYYRENGAEQILAEVKTFEEENNFKSVTDAVAKIKRGRELKIIIQMGGFKNLKDSTKSLFWNAAVKIL